MSKVIFNDVVRRANTKEDKDNTEKEFYIGGEHIDSNEVLITKRGMIAGSTIGPMFYFGFTAGQVLLVSRNPHLRKAGMVTFDGICSEKTFVLESIDESILLQRYLPFLLQSDHFWSYAEANKSGSVNFFINWSTLAKYEFELPSIAKQKELSDLLWSINDTKLAYRNVIQKTDELIKSQFIKMFGRINDEGFYIRKQWAEVLQIINGRSYKSVADDNGPYPVYGTGGIMGRASEYLCPENSVVMGRKGTIDKPYIVEEKFWNVDTAFGVVANPGVLHYLYLFWYCKQLDYTKLNKASTLPSTTKADLLKLWINIPPYELQEQFATIVHKADKSKLELKQIIATTEALYRNILAENFD